MTTEILIAMKTLIHTLALIVLLSKVYAQDQIITKTNTRRLYSRNSIEWYIASPGLFNSNLLKNIDRQFPRYAIRTAHIFNENKYVFAYWDNVIISEGIESNRFQQMRNAWEPVQWRGTRDGDHSNVAKALYIDHNAEWILTETTQNFKHQSKIANHSAYFSPDLIRDFNNAFNIWDIQFSDDNSYVYREQMQGGTNAVRSNIQGLVDKVNERVAQGLANKIFLYGVHDYLILDKDQIYYSNPEKVPPALDIVLHNYLNNEPKDWQSIRWIKIFDSGEWLVLSDQSPAYEERQYNQSSGNGEFALSLFNTVTRGLTNTFENQTKYYQNQAQPYKYNSGNQNSVNNAIVNNSQKQSSTQNNSQSSQSYQSNSAATEVLNNKQSTNQSQSSVNCNYDHYRLMLQVNAKQVRGCLGDASLTSLSFGIDNTGDETVTFQLWYQNDAGKWQSEGSHSISPGGHVSSLNNCTTQREYYILAYKDGMNQCYMSWPPIK